MQRSVPHYLTSSESQTGGLVLDGQSEFGMKINMIRQLEDGIGMVRPQVSATDVSFQISRLSA